MNWSDPDFRRRSVSWFLLGALSVLCLALAVLEYSSLREVSDAESYRRREALEGSLRSVGNQFDAVVTRGVRAMVREASGLPQEEWETAYLRGYMRWRESGNYPGLFRRVYRVLPGEPSPGGTAPESPGIVHRLDPNGAFVAAEWPAEWSRIRDNLAGRIARGRLFGPIAERESAVFEIPRFAPRSQSGPPAAGRRREFADPVEWLLFELDLDYVRKEVIPQIVQTQLTDRGVREFELEIRSLADPAVEIFRSGAEIGDARGADARVRLFEIRFDDVINVRRPPGSPRNEGAASGGAFGNGAEPPPAGGAKRGGGPPRPEGGEGRGRWELLARHQSGSLEAAVRRAHLRNAALTGAIILLILGSALALMRFNRNAQRLAELQVEFISGISHELRTPLSVIASAAFNLKKGVVKDPAQMKKYGEMIHAESERLTAIVEQVLRFARTRSGSALAVREPMSAGSIVEEAIEASSRALNESACTLEKAIEPELPPVSGDAVALKQAVQNLIGNAAKYGWEGGWIGVSAIRAVDAKGREWVEIRVADRGPGIPAAEIDRIFTPFYRGKRAVDDQVHGTGLGLNLAKKIVEAHEGTITAMSEPGRQTEFTVRIPAIPVEQRDEFAHTAG
ncbi:MAG: HAMP domain-containing sensor histidine kinase [Bryobacteraceae bacterium]